MAASNSDYTPPSGLSEKQYQALLSSLHSTIQRLEHQIAALALKMSSLRDTNSNSSSSTTPSVFDFPPPLLAPLIFSTVVVNNAPDKPDNSFTKVLRKGAKRVRKDSAKSSSTEDESAPNSRPSPPITIRQKINWPSLRNSFEKRNIKFRRAVNMIGGIKLYPFNVSHFRSTACLLDENKIEYSSHQLPEKKETIVVLREVNEAFREEDIKSELSDYPVV